jgi:hypothetical protein
MSTNNGVILYDGVSQLDGKTPIIVVMTGLDKVSHNAKTGDMLQTWILLKNVAPHLAIKTGDDAAICGDCKYRGVYNLSTKSWDKERPCYVATHQAPLAVYKAYHRGNYPPVTPLQARLLIKEHRTGAVRIGSYGDPMAAPVFVWQNLLVFATRHTGYSHQWHKQHDASAWRPIVMASVDTDAEAQSAIERGYRYFRVMPDTVQDKRTEVLCPASEQGGRKSQCSKCGLCSGTASNATKSVAIVQH